MKQLYPYQRKIVNIMKDNPGYALFLEQGLGKTQIILDEFYNDCLDNKVDVLFIIVAPNGLQSIWLQQLNENNFFEEINTGVFLWDGKDNKKKEKQIKNCLQSERMVILVNIEALSVKHGEIKPNKFIVNLSKIYEKPLRTTLVIDQSVCIKNPSAIQTQNTFEVMKALQQNNCLYKKRILEGDPCSSGIDALYCQINFINDEILNCQSYNQFHLRYNIVETFKINVFNKTKCEFESKVYTKTIGATNVDSLKKLLKPITTWLRTEQCHDLPPLTIMQQTFKLSKKEERMVQKAIDEKIVPVKIDIDDDDFEYVEKNVFHQLTVLLYLQMICSGYGEEDYKKVSKIIRLKDLLTETNLRQKNKKLIIFCNYHFEIDLICSMLDEIKESYSCYHGKLKGKDRERNMNDFVNGDIRILVGTQATLSKGFTLTCANDAIFYSRGWSYNSYYESMKRLHRISQDSPVFIHNLISDTPIEWKIVLTLNNKKDLLSLVRDDMDIKNLLK